MKLHIYQGLDNEKVPKDVTHMIVGDNSIIVIKKYYAFLNYIHLVCSVVVEENVKRNEMTAFDDCTALRFVRLSKALECIRDNTVHRCDSSESFLFLPSAVKSIEDLAFFGCDSLRLLVLSDDIDLGNVSDEIIDGTGFYHLVESSGVICVGQGW